jgi:hypothetical protein
MSMITNLPMGVFTTLEAAMTIGKETIKKVSKESTYNEYAPYYYVLECNENEYNPNVHYGESYGKQHIP